MNSRLDHDSFDSTSLFQRLRELEQKRQEQRAKIYAEKPTDPLGATVNELLLAGFFFTLVAGALVTLILLAL